jgi:hypothetical protein
MEVRLERGINNIERDNEKARTVEGLKLFLRICMRSCHHMHQLKKKRFGEIEVDD